MKKNKGMNRDNFQDSFFHQPTPKRPVSRMGFQKTKGTIGMRKGVR